MFPKNKEVNKEDKVSRKEGTIYRRKCQDDSEEEAPGQPSGLESNPSKLEQEEGELLKGTKERMCLSP